MKKTEMTLEQAKQIYSEHPEWIDSVLSEWKDELTNNILKLKVDKKQLQFMINDTKMGHISPDGELFIYWNTNTLKANKKWREDGQKFDENVVTWKNGKYALTNPHVLSKHVILAKKDVQGGHIYNFTCKTRMKYCGDYNIKNLHIVVDCSNKK